MIVNQFLTRYQVLDSSLVNTVGFSDSFCDSPKSRLLFLLCNASPSNLLVPPIMAATDFAILFWDIINQSTVPINTQLLEDAARIDPILQRIAG